MRMKLAALLLACLPAGSAALERVADTHLHYKWSQQGVTTAADVLDILEAQNIVMGVVIGTPAELALQLAQLAPHRIVPLFSPYQSGGDWHNWAFDDSVVTRARTALATGLYHGIGELHLVGGFAPRLDKARVLPDLLKLAGEYDVPIMLHTEFSRPDLLLELCTQFPETRILWAHAGAIQAPVDVARVLSACDNVSADLAARDPWRFVNNPVADARGRLLPEWRALFIEYLLNTRTGCCSARIRSGRLTSWTAGTSRTPAGRSWAVSGAFTAAGCSSCRLPRRARLAVKIRSRCSAVADRCSAILWRKMCARRGLMQQLNCASWRPVINLAGNSRDMRSERCEERE
jgi:hypothetical protein